MTKRTLKTEFEPGRGYTREDWDEAMDNPKSTDEELSQFQPFMVALPELAESIKRGPGRPKVDAPKVQVSLRLDPDVLEKWRSTGKGWQGRVNEALRAVELRKLAETVGIGKQVRVVDEVDLREEARVRSGRGVDVVIVNERTGEVTPLPDDDNRF